MSCLHVQIRAGGKLYSLCDRVRIAADMVARFALALSPVFILIYLAETYDLLQLGQLYGRPKQSVAAPSALPKRSAASQRKHSHSSSTLRPRRSPRLAENVRLPKPDAEHEEALPRSHRILGVDHSTRSAGATAPQQRIVPIETGSSQSVSAVVAVHMSASCQMESPAPVSQPVAPQAKAMEPHTCTLQRELDKALRERDELFNDNVLLVEGYRELQNQMESKEA
ncbi:hypothetical protein BJX66DRAFT_346005, partial [Aspergillus keveii]